LRDGLAGCLKNVIAPRGEFSEGALALKRWKKVPYRLLTRIFGLYRNLIWQASSDYELRDIKKAMSGIAQRIHVASDLPPKPKMEHLENSALGKKENAELRVCFLSRITPMKNLDYALRILSQIRLPVKFSIIGPVRDETYWAKCQKVMESLPEHIEVSVVGSIEPAQVASMMESHDLFFLPTLGENYGHVIPEALAAGTPVLIADTTPWRGLYEAGVGWDLPLDDEQGFIDAIELTAKMSPREYAAWRTRIKEYAIEPLSNSEAINANRQLFIKATLKQD
jgi:glycosyltransferase involved in cell wall biosynthesis